MSDDRPVHDVPAELAELRRQLADLRTTALARASRMPVGTIEPTLELNSTSDTLLLQGQTVTRAAYPVLWQWIVDRGLAGPNLPFGVGDGSTNFVLPDLRGKALVGATAVDPVGKSFGSATATLTASMMPLHTHVIPTQGDHQHAWLTAQGGNHGSHVNGHIVQVGYVPAPDHASWNRVSSWDGNSGTHNHTFDSGWEGEHNHGGATGQAGKNPPDSFFVVQPSYAVNVRIWT